jgi:hypothetical protein
MERGNNMSRCELVRALKTAKVTLNGEMWIYGIGDSANLYQEGLEREGVIEKIAGYCVDISGGGQ